MLHHQNMTVLPFVGLFGGMARMLVANNPKCLAEVRKER
jgi:hypothetical protein